MAELAVGACADADEVAEAPVIQIVACSATGLGVGRHFVLGVAMAGQQGLTCLLDIPEDVILRQQGRLVPEYRVGFQGQLIPREMRRFQVDGLAQVVQGVVQSLIGQAVHQVQVEVVETGLTRHIGGAHRFVAGMNPTQRRQLGFLEALDSDRQAIDAQLPVGHELLLFECTGVGFQSDFDVGGERNALLHALKQAPQCLCAEQAGRATPEENRAQLAAVDCGQVQVEVSQ
ncbi:hypothetical protein D3C80_1159270 [compost metagenome]